MRLVSLGLSLCFILLVGCGKHDLRCDARLTPINPPAPAAPVDVKPSEKSSP